MTETSKHLSDIHDSIFLLKHIPKASGAQTTLVSTKTTPYSTLIFCTVLNADYASNSECKDEVFRKLYCFDCRGSSFTLRRLSEASLVFKEDRLLQTYKESAVTVFSIIEKLK